MYEWLQTGTTTRVPYCRYCVGSLARTQENADHLYQDTNSDLGIISLSHAYWDVHYTNGFTRRTGGREMAGSWLRDSVSSVRAGFSDLDPGHLDIILVVLTCWQKFGLPLKGWCRQKCLDGITMNQVYSMDDLPLAASNRHAEYPTCSAAGPRPQRIGPRGGVCRCEASGAWRLGNQH